MRSSWISKSVFLACISTISLAHGAVLVHDTFDVPAGGIINTNITVGDQPTDPLDVAWSMPAPGAGANISIVTTATLGGSGNSMLLNANGINFQWYRSATIDTGGELAINDFLQLTFKAQYTGTPANNSSGYRFGLFQNSVPDNSYGVFVRTGTNNGSLFTARRDNVSGGDGVPGAGGSTEFIPNIATPNGSIPNNSTGIDALLKVTRTGATSMQLDITINGVSNTFTDPNGLTSLDAIYIRNGSVSTNFRVDDVRLERGVIPEPASLSLLGLAGLTMLSGYRRR